MKKKELEEKVENELNQNYLNDPKSEIHAVKFLGDISIHPGKPTWNHFVKNPQVTSPFGWRTLPTGKNFHDGTDYTGLNKIAVAPCRCVIAKILNPNPKHPYRFKYENGKWIEIAPTSWTPYVILQSVYDPKLRFAYRHGITKLSVGDEVDSGKKIIDVGGYGYSFGSHLHVDVYISEKKVDPDEFIIKKLKRS